MELVSKFLQRVNKMKQLVLVAGTTVNTSISIEAKVIKTGVIVNFLSYGPLILNAHTVRVCFVCRPAPSPCPFQS